MSVRARLEALPGGPWVTGAVLLCTTGTLGAVATSAMPVHVVRRAAGVADVFRVNPGTVTVWYAAVMAVVTAAGLAALCWSVRRSWPWLILSGVMLTGALALAELTAWDLMSSGVWRAILFLAALRAGAAQLVLLGVLAAGTRLAWTGARGAGAFLIGAAFGAQVFGAAMDIEVYRALAEAGPLGPAPGMDAATFVRPLLRDGMVLTAVGAAVLVVLLHRVYGARPEPAGPEDPDPDPRPDRRTAVAGAAAALAFVPVTVLWKQEQALSATGYAVLLAAGLLLAAAAGARVLATTATATLAVAGISGPAGMLMFAQPGALVRMWLLVGAAVLAGAALAYPAWRRWSASAACAAAGLILLLILAVRPGRQASHEDPVAVAVLFALVLAASAAVAASGVRRGAEAAAPVVLGPLLTAAVVGACGLLARWQGTGRRGPGPELFGEPGPLGAYAAMLLAAAALIAAPAPSGLRVLRRKAAPATSDNGART
ncbi:hypothetical protein [Actinomadura sp. 21ATH]|uniref:hypothetical protein n=1 Tax=Actinomadura sp. 21ATH TaxID=1735444 RepID=UPI0035BF7306